MAVNTSLGSISREAFGVEQARHLLQRAGFGGSPRAVRELAALGLDAAVDRLVRYRLEASNFTEPDLDPDIMKPLGEDVRAMIRQARRQGDEDAQSRFIKERLQRQADDRRMHRDLQQWWLRTMLDTDQPAREKLTLLWHGHFATRHKSVKDAYLMYRQNALFRGHARRFDELARGIVRDPAMLIFLNNDKNNRRQPNENLSRELMELFTLGEGHYSERDIREGARALTGYHVDDNDFAFRRAAHDPGRKTILGREGEFDGDGFVDLLLRRRECSEYVALKLYRHLVADVPDTLERVNGPAKLVIVRLAEMIRASEYDLEPVLAALFKSEHFYDAGVVGQMIKSPVQLVVGTVRALGTPAREERRLVESLGVMGQDLFEPPSVAGWEGGRAWINTSTLFVRQNLCAYLITGKDPRREKWNRREMGYDPRTFLAELPTEQRGDPQAVVDFAVDALIGSRLPGGQREPLVKFLRARRELNGDAVAALLLLVTAMPEYQLC